MEVLISEEESNSARKSTCQQDSENKDALQDHNLHGWEPDVNNLTQDELYADLVTILTRNSTCRQGHMACAIVRHPHDDSNESCWKSRIVSVANNSSLYTEGDSDVHAEMNALCYAARDGGKTDKTTAYITMPPCKNCFGALVSAGVSRIVSFQSLTASRIAEAARKRGIEFVAMDPIASKSRIGELGRPSQGKVEADRMMRKQEKEHRKAQARLKRKIVDVPK